MINEDFLDPDRYLWHEEDDAETYELNCLATDRGDHEALDVSEDVGHEDEIYLEGTCGFAL